MTYIQDLQNAMNALCSTLLRPGHSDPATRHVFILRRDQIDPDQMWALLAVARVLHSRNGTLSGQLARAQAVASLVRITRPGQSLLPSVRDLRRVSATVAIAVARAAEADGVAERPLTDPIQQVFDTMWQPVYPEMVLDEG